MRQRSESVGNKPVSGLNFEVMEFDQMVPAPGQGAIAINQKFLMKIFRFGMSDLACGSAGKRS